MRHFSSTLLFAGTLLAGSLLFSALTPARADSLTGDTVTVYTYCYDNAACSGATATDPTTRAIYDDLVPSDTDTPVTRSVYDDLGNQVTITEYDDHVQYSYDAQTQIPANTEPDGVYGLYSTYSYDGQGLDVPIESTNGSTDGLTLPATRYSYDDVSLPPGDLINLEGLNNTINLYGDLYYGTPSPVPEPPSWLLWGSGALALLGWGLFQRRQRSARLYQA